MDEDQIAEAVRTILSAGEAIGEAKKQTAVVEAEQREKERMRVVWRAQKQGQRARKCPADKVEMSSGQSRNVRRTNCPKKQYADNLLTENNEPFTIAEAAAIAEGVNALKALMQQAFTEGEEHGKECARKEKNAEKNAARGARRIAKRQQADGVPDGVHPSPPSSPLSFPPHPLTIPPYNPPTSKTRFACARERDACARVGAHARTDGERKSDCAGKETLERFGRFWRIYPRRIHRDAALRAWCALDPSEDLTQFILDAVNVLMLSRQWTQAGTRFVPSPANFLRGKRWEDVAEMAETTDTP